LAGVRILVCPHAVAIYNRYFVAEVSVYSSKYLNAFYRAFDLWICLDRIVNRSLGLQRSIDRAECNAL
jgi:hypothetical protein